jgi:hypothetical protein
MSTKKKPQAVPVDQNVTPAPEGYVYVWNDWMEDAEEDGFLIPTISLHKVVLEVDGRLSLHHPGDPEKVVTRDKGFVALTKEGALEALRTDMERKRDLLAKALNEACDVLLIGTDGELEDETLAL